MHATHYTPKHVLGALHRCTIFKTYQYERWKRLANHVHKWFFFAINPCEHISTQRKGIIRSRKWKHKWTNTKHTTKHVTIWSHIYNKWLREQAHSSIWKKILWYTKTMIFLVKRLEVVASCCLKLNFFQGSLYLWARCANIEYEDKIFKAYN